MKLTDNFNTDIDKKVTGGLDWDKLPSQVQENARKLAENVQAIRDRLGLAISVTSGYRPADQNVRVGGSKTSQHVHGEAWDIVIKGQTRELLDDVARDIMEGRLQLPHPCSQIIVETNQFGRHWIHLAIKTDRWIEYNKEMIKSTVSEIVRAKHNKRLVACEFLSTHDARTFEMVGYRPYSDFGKE